MTKNSEIGDVWYRYENQLVSNGTDEYGDSMGNHVEVQCYEYTVSKVTEKGVWLGLFVGAHDRWVSFTHTKRFACPTKELAQKSFVARKEREIAIHSRIIARSTEAIKLVMADQRRTGMRMPA